ncbi:MAG: argininosuccinate lyase [Fimbriimonadales bacterium]|nr:MAG: argininosuccinate lyase [Fimbriimonadales bacterium]GIV07981.1 MAG: argininosuccinate lyase [Fimbriimonadales bacterium]
MLTPETPKMWGGRFEGSLSPDAQAYSFSLQHDVRLWKQELHASAAHARMMGITGMLSPHEANRIVDALLEIHAEIEEGEWFPFDEYEDIHTAIEARLFEKIGALAGKLHTGRSRNDLVATEVRMWLRERTTDLARAMLGLCHQLMHLAEQHQETLMPGLTHQQHAQPVTLGHHLMTHCWAFIRDLSRLAHAGDRMNLCPLGAGALSGTTFPIDRELLAAELGFGMPIPNSMDAVSDRDFIAEYLFVSALLMVHLSRLAQELILWSTPEYGYVELSDEHTTGSSMMPQKKNPDIAELIRGRSALVMGNLMGILALLKGLPLTYNRDLQDDKPLLFATMDTVIPSVRLMSDMLEKAHWRTDRMRAALQGDFSTATELADYLVRKGVPFREAHHIVGQIVRECLQHGVGLEALTLERLQKHHLRFEADALEAIDPERAVRARTILGGTAPESVMHQIEQAKNWLAAIEHQLNELLNPN